MDRMQMIRRRALAQNQLGVVVRRLGRLAGMRAAARDALDVSNRVRDPDAKALYELEGMTSFLDALSDKLESVKAELAELQSDDTDEPEDEEPEPEAEEETDASEIATAVASDTEPQRATGDAETAVEPSTGDSEASVQPSPERAVAVRKRTPARRTAGTTGSRTLPKPSLD